MELKICEFDTEVILKTAFDWIRFRKRRFSIRSGPAELVYSYHTDDCDKPKGKLHARVKSATHFDGGRTQAVRGSVIKWDEM